MKELTSQDKQVLIHTAVSWASSAMMTAAVISMSNVIKALTEDGDVEKSIRDAHAAEYAECTLTQKRLKLIKQALKKLDIELPEEIEDLLGSTGVDFDALMGNIAGTD